MSRSLAGISRRFVLLSTLAAAVAAVSQADTLVGITADNNLISINTANPGSATLVGALSSPASTLGIFAANSNLYLFNTNTDLLNQISPTTGALLSTIDIGIHVTPGEGDLAFFNGTGYLASTLDAAGNFNGTTGTLYKFTLNANSATVVTQSIPLLDGLAVSATGTLYGLAQGGTNLYTINVATGAATLVGSTGISNNCGGFACYSFGALSFGSSGNLFASLTNFSNGTSAFFQINPATANATQLANVPFDQVSGLTSLVPPVATPEPATLLLGLCCFASLAIVRKTKRARQ